MRYRCEPVDDNGYKKINKFILPARLIAAVAVAVMELMDYRPVVLN